jgi:hypothetical protein
VQVNVEDRLACICIAVEDGSIPAIAMALLDGDRRPTSHHLAHEPIITS